MPRRIESGVTATRLVACLRDDLAQAGLTGSFLVRDLNTGEEIGIDPDIELPIASLAKVPLAVAVVNRIGQGHIDGAMMIDIVARRTDVVGPHGLSRFRHPASVAIDDLLYLSLAISDNAAADALFALVPPAEVTEALRAAGLGGITVRHTMRDLEHTPVERFAPGEAHLAHALAIGSGAGRRGHVIPQLDVSRATTGTARALVDLLEALWRPSRIPVATAERVRSLMADNAIRHRLAPDFASDASRWSSKTGSLLHLRHEIGVVEHDEGESFAVAALTESSVPAAVQPAAEATMARVARRLHDHLWSTYEADG